MTKSLFSNRAFNFFVALRARRQAECVSYSCNDCELVTELSFGTVCGTCARVAITGSPLKKIGAMHYTIRAGIEQKTE